VAQADKFRGHCFAFASLWTKVAQTDKFRGHFFGFTSSWTKVAQADKLKSRQCILLNTKYILHKYHIYIENKKNTKKKNIKTNIINK